MPRVVARERELRDGRAGSSVSRILVIEDDDGDALLVEEMLRDADERFQLVRARTLAEALAQVGDAIDCAVLDLGLPDAAGMNPLAPLLEAAGDVPVVVLTGLIDRHAGKAAVAAGAQDYLVKGEVSGDTLGHALRYAMERGAAVAAGRQSLLAERRQLENEHLARGLVPRPILADTPVAVVTRYRPGGPEALLGGDFFDVIECPDGTVRLLIGDVCGHGPDEAAIGVALRISWRALVLAGLPTEQVLAGMDAVFVGEQRGDALFATVAEIEIAADQRSIRVHLCGHPPPILVEPELRWLDEVRPRPPIGLAHDLALHGDRGGPPASWALLQVTDGLFEGRGADGERIGRDGMLDGRQAPRSCRAGARRLPRPAHRRHHRQPRGRTSRRRGRRLGRHQAPRCLSRVDGGRRCGGGSAGCSRRPPSSSSSSGSSGCTPCTPCWRPASPLPSRSSPPSSMPSRPCRR